MVGDVSESIGRNNIKNITTMIEIDNKRMWENILSFKCEVEIDDVKNNPAGIAVKCIGDAIKHALKDQGLEYKHGEIVSMNPDGTETDFESKDELAESEDERIRKGLIEYFLHYPDHEITYYDLKADFVISWLEKQGKNNMGISEATKQELEDNLNKALEKETPESWNEFLEKQGEQKPRYSIGDVLCDKSCTTLNKGSQSNFEITDIRNGMYICDKCSFPISQQDEYELVAKRIESVWSEEDEKMRNVAIDACKYMVDNFENSTKQYEDAIAWLKKQVKQKPIESMPEFKEGDILYNKDSYASDSIFIFKGMSDKTNAYLCYARLYDKKDFSVYSKEDWDEGVGIYGGEFYPANHKQKELLFSEIEKAGYKWNPDEKKMEKIEQNPAFEMKTPEESLGVDSDTYNKIVDECIYGEQKPADDIERKYNPCYNMPFKKAQEYISNRGFDIPWTNCDVFVDFRYVTQTVANILRWADNNPKQKSAWSVEDETMFRKAIVTIDNVRMDTDFQEYYQGICDWLESLKDRVLPQPKQEWSEEDDRHRIHTISLVEDLREWANKDGMHSLCLERCAESIDWLKSLRPQNTWKPSDEQMVALEHAINCYSGISPTNTEEVYTLEIMKEQLKKLKE